MYLLLHISVTKVKLLYRGYIWSLEEFSNGEKKPWVGLDLDCLWIEPNLPNSMDNFVYTVLCTWQRHGLPIMVTRWPLQNKSAILIMQPHCFDRTDVNFLLLSTIAQTYTVTDFLSFNFLWLCRFLQQSLRNKSLQMNDYKIALLCNAYSTNSECFTLPMGVLVETIYGNGNMMIPLPGTNCMASGSITPLPMNLLDSLTVHAKMRYCIVQWYSNLQINQTRDRKKIRPGAHCQSAHPLLLRVLFFHPLCFYSIPVR